MAKDNREAHIDDPILQRNVSWALAPDSWRRHCRALRWRVNNIGGCRRVRTCRRIYDMNVVVGLRWRINRTHHNGIIDISSSPTKILGRWSGGGTGLLTSSLGLKVNLSMVSLSKTFKRMGQVEKRVTPSTLGFGLFPGSLSWRGR